LSNEKVKGRKNPKSGGTLQNSRHEKLLLRHCWYEQGPRKIKRTSGGKLQMKLGLRSKVSFNQRRLYRGGGRELYDTEDPSVRRWAVSTQRIEGGAEKMSGIKKNPGEDRQDARNLGKKMRMTDQRGKTRKGESALLSPQGGVQKITMTRGKEEEKGKRLVR